MIIQEEKMFLHDIGSVTAQSRLPSTNQRIRSCRKILIGYSSRNSSFTKDWLKEVFLWAKQERKSVLIVIVDEPYAYNDAALIGEEIPSEKLYQKSRRIGDERSRMVSATARSIHFEKYEIYRWGQLRASSKVKLFAAECEEAFNVHDRLVQTLISYVERWKGHIEFQNITLAARFLLEEIPVFCWLYYVKNRNVDFYPGQMFPLFWEIEAGLWKEELPKISIAAAGKSLLFVSVPPR